jgi:hypothetical protein
MMARYSAILGAILGGMLDACHDRLRGQLTHTLSAHEALS